MSALAHYIEDEGVPTAAMSLIRPHSERIGNPRSLWVPFELGRPLGPPGDAAFQTGVLEAALGLLEAGPGPVVLRDFDRDDPTSLDLEGWTPPFEVPEAEADTTHRGSVEAALKREVAAVSPSYRRFVSSTGRTTFGNSGLGLEACVDHVLESLTGTPPPSPIPDMAGAQFLRFALDDLKAFYLEAASAGTGMPSSRQMQIWFWDRTFAARVIVALRAALMASDDQRSQAIGRLNTVPGVQAARLKLG